MTLRVLAACALRVLAAPPASAQAPAARSVTTYRVDPARSTITYAMSHPAHDWNGTSRAVVGTLAIGGDGVVTGGRVAAPVTSFDSGNRNRDANMVEATEAYVHRNVTFELGRLTPLERPTPTANATAEGALTFHGVRRAVRLPVRVDRTTDGLRVRGQFDVTLTEFEVEPPSLLGLRVRDRIGLTLDLAFIRS